MGKQKIKLDLEMLVFESDYENAFNAMPSRWINACVRVQDSCIVCKVAR